MASTTTLQPTAAQANKAAFSEGVRLILATWTTLSLAVQNEWGGPESAEKEAWLGETIVDFFGKRSPDQGRLEEMVEDILSVEFNVIAEDRSIASILMRMFYECSRGNHATVNDLRQKYPQMLQSKQQALSASNAGKGAGVEGDNDDDDDDDDDEGYANLDDVLQQGSAEDDDAMDASSSSAAAPPAQSEPEAVADPDGWQTVPARGKGKRR